MATGLRCSAPVPSLQIPPALAPENIYRFPNSDGYDGQAYHLVAHDPLALHGILTATADASLRYRRILLPALAYLVALGARTGSTGRTSSAICYFCFWAHGVWRLYLRASGLRRGSPCSTCSFRPL